MALVNPIGYAGPVSNEEWAIFAGNMASPYSVLPDEDDPYGDPSTSMRPTILNGPARTVRIAPGRAFGAGVIDTNDANIDYALPDPGGSGYRWYLIVLRRVWGATKASQITHVVGTTSAVTPLIPNARSKGPGVQDDQPIALALCKGGDPTIQRLIDLRTFYGPGGLYAIDPIVQQFLPVGSSFRCGDTVYTHTLSDNLSPTWIAKRDPIFGIPPTLAIGRNTMFGTDLPTVQPMGLYAGLPTFTSKQGAADTHMTGKLGGSNYASATGANPNIASITMKTAGTYAIGARLELRSGSAFRVNFALSCPGVLKPVAPVGYDNPTPVGGLAATTISLTDTLYFPAGARVEPRWSTYGATRLYEWYIWATKILDA